MYYGNTINHRYDFLLAFDVVNGNPNGDPDAGNSPRMDPETGHGLVSDVCLKRKIRDFITLTQVDKSGCPRQGYDIYVRHGAILNQQHQKAYEALGLEEKKGLDNTAKARLWMCQTFFDIRTFGAVMTTGVNCGQVRGPLQLAFARSVDPIISLEQAITRKAVTREEDAKKQLDKDGHITGTFGRKEIIPYGLYVVHGFINPYLAQATGFSEEDLEFVWQSLLWMFEQDHSATRAEMATRKLIIFKHQSKLGNAPAHALFDRVHFQAKKTPARSFADYEIQTNAEGLPEGVELIEKM